MKAISDRLSPLPRKISEYSFEFLPFVVAAHSTTPKIGKNQNFEINSLKFLGLILEAS
jgi:hypothetical protein